jgi:hypothetical protein
LLKRAAVVIAIFAALALCWVFGAKWYKNYFYWQGQKQLQQTKAALINNYKNAEPDPIVLSADEMEEVPVSKAAAAAPPEKPHVYMSDICHDPAFKTLSEWEQQDVVVAIRPHENTLNNLDFLRKCRER